VCCKPTRPSEDALTIAGIRIVEVHAREPPVASLAGLDELLRFQRGLLGFRRRSNHLGCITFRLALHLLLLGERWAAAHRLPVRRTASASNNSLFGKLLEQLDELLPPTRNNCVHALGADQGP